MTVVHAAKKRESKSLHYVDPIDSSAAVAGDHDQMWIVVLFLIFATLISHSFIFKVGYENDGEASALWLGRRETASCCEHFHKITQPSYLVEINSLCSR